MAQKIDILFEDNHLLVVYKPKGVLSQADGSHHLDMLTLLKEYIKEKYQKPGAVYLGLVHRLDINTSGVMVFAKTSKAAKRLSLQIRNHEFEKKYRAVVEGVLTSSGTLKHNLLKDGKLKKSFVDEKGQESILKYEVIASKGAITLVDITLLTGRFHQIRAQFQAIGHPLYGDAKYGSKYRIDSMKFPLEAYHLAFYHPITKELLVFEQQNLQLESF